MIGAARNWINPTKTTMNKHPNTPITAVTGNAFCFLTSTFFVFLLTRPPKTVTPYITYRQTTMDVDEPSAIASVLRILDGITRITHHNITMIKNSQNPANNLLPGFFSNNFFEPNNAFSSARD